MPTTLFTKTIDERFAEFHEANRWVFDEFVRIALEVKSLGHDQYSADAILHIVRWETRRDTTRDGGFKINDHFTSRYARLAMDVEPRLDGFFATRRLSA